MKLIEKMRAFPWADVLAGGRLLLSLLGIVWLVGFFLQRMPWWIVLPETFFVFAALVACWLLATWWRERKRSRRMADVLADTDVRIARIRARRRAEGLPLRRESDARIRRSASYPEITPLMRKRFVRFGDDGEPVYHLEAEGTL